ncbi:MAG: hypothetical protein ACREID_08505, partial [Planctomycetota bacterium]
RRRVVVTVPSWRAGRDVDLPEDLVEEVGRIHGYDRIEPSPLVGALDPVPEEPRRVARRRARSALSGACGLAEIYVYPFTTAAECHRAEVTPGALAVRNAEHPGLDLLAGSLLPNLLRSVRESLKYRDEAPLYVVAPVFLKEEAAQGLPRENERVGVAVARRRGADVALEVKGVVETVLDAFRLRGARVDQREGPPWLHPGRSARLAHGPEVLGWFGQLHPRVARAFEIDAEVGIADLDLDALAAAEPGSGRMAPVSRYPTVAYDVAVVVDRRIPAAAVEEALRAADREHVRSARLFDVYEAASLGPGKRSLAFRVILGSMERTLAPADVERLHRAVNEAIARRGWSLRA